MGRMELVPIRVDDVGILDKTEYKNLSVVDRLALIEDSTKGQSKGEFFRFYLIKAEKEVVGVINVFGHGKEKISVAPEIFIEHRNKGYAKKSLTTAYSIAKELGFKIVIAGIRSDNIASQRLHEKLGFTWIGESVSKRGNLMKNYKKEL